MLQRHGPCHSNLIQPLHTRHLCRCSSTARIRRQDGCRTRRAAQTSPEVSCSWLKENNAEDCSIVDVRAYDAYFAAHIPGAVPIEPPKMLCALPQIPSSDASAADSATSSPARLWVLDLDSASFAAQVESKGISADKPVLVYDDGGLQTSAFVWWALCVHGHPQVKVLSGGWPAWCHYAAAKTEAGDPCCPLKLQSYFEAEPQLQLVVTPDDLRQYSVDTSTLMRLVEVVDDVTGGWKAAHAVGEREESAQGSALMMTGAACVGSVGGTRSPTATGSTEADAPSPQRLRLSEILERCEASSAYTSASSSNTDGSSNTGGSHNGSEPHTWRLQAQPQLRAALAAHSGGAGVRGSARVVFASMAGPRTACVAALAWAQAYGDVNGIAVLNGRL